MKTRLIGGVVTCLLATQAGMAIEMWKGPLEKLCQENDLVVVVKFLEATEIPQEQKEPLEKLIAPSGWQKQYGVLKKCRFQIVDVIRNNASEKLGDTLTAVAYFDPSDRNVPRIACPRQTVWFWDKSNDLLILSRLAKDKDYYVSPSSQLTMSASPENVAEVRVAANPEKWAWPESVNGISVAINIRHYACQGGARGARVIMALRNTTAKTIEFTASDNAAIFKARDPNGHLLMSQHEEQQKELAPILARIRAQAATNPALAPETKPAKAAIKPGEILFVRDDFYLFKNNRGDLRGLWEVPKTNDSSLWSGKITTDRIEIAGPPPRPERPR